MGEILLFKNILLISIIHVLGKKQSDEEANPCTNW